jgi:hypothetical protein
MCQQWFSVAGLVLELVGFLLIAREWYHGFSQMAVLRQQRVQEDYVRTRRAQGLPYEDTSEGDASMWRNTQRENRIDNRRRARIFFWGAGLVVLGVVFQVLGSWPYGLRLLRLVSCQ